MLTYSIYSIYACKLFSIIKSHLPSSHSQADDTQVHLSFRPLESTCEADELDAMEKCIADVRPWMINNKVMLNMIRLSFWWLARASSYLFVSRHTTTAW